MFITPMVFFPPVFLWINFAFAVWPILALQLDLALHLHLQCTCVQPLGGRAVGAGPFLLWMLLSTVWSLSPALRPRVHEAALAKHLMPEPTSPGSQATSPCHRHCYHRHHCLSFDYAPSSYTRFL